LFRESLTLLDDLSPIPVTAQQLHSRHYVKLKNCYAACAIAARRSAAATSSDGLIPRRDLV